MNFSQVSYENANHFIDNANSPGKKICDFHNRKDPHEPD